MNQISTDCIAEERKEHILSHSAVTWRKKIKFWLLLFIAIGGIGSHSSSYAQPQNTGPFFLRSVLPDERCLDAGGGWLGAYTYMRKCDRNNGNLRWYIHRDGVLSADVLPYFCLDASYGTAISYTYMRGCDAGNINLHWRFRKVSGTSYYHIYSLTSGLRCLDANTGAFQRRTYMRSCDTGQNPNLLWRLESAPMASVYSGRCDTPRLRNVRNHLVDIYSTSHGSSLLSINRVPQRKLSHTNVGRLLEGLARWSGLNDADKFCVWDLLAIGKVPSDVRGYYNFTGARVYPNTRVTYTITEDGAHPRVINADINGKRNTAAHTVSAFTADPYHNSMQYLNISQMIDKIKSKESGIKSTILCEPFCPNKGDIESSIRTGMLQQRFRNGREFGEFARWWKALFLPGGPCPGHILEIDRTYRTTYKSCRP